jgi:hypothetical protein
MFALCGSRLKLVRALHLETQLLRFSKCFLAFFWHLINPNYLITENLILNILVMSRTLHSCFNRRGKCGAIEKAATKVERSS